MVNVIAHLLSPGGAVPNHPTWPLLIYPSAVKPATPEIFEELFTRNHWPAAWRNGVHPFHHFHSNGHEALGIYSGEVTVQFGGDAGITVTAKRGDVIVLPAGTGHKKLSSKGALGVVGAYPQGTDSDTCRSASSNHLQAIARVPLPACDPVYGAGGPLFSHWLK
jgi:uncharacterized protein YjlB